MYACLCMYVPLHMYLGEDTKLHDVSCDRDINHLCNRILLFVCVSVLLFIVCSVVQLNSLFFYAVSQAVSNLTVTSLTVNSLTLKWNQPDNSDNVINNWYNVSLQSRSEYLQNITLNCSQPVITIFSVSCTN